MENRQAIITHNASTLPGASGSAVCPIENNQNGIYFLGIRNLKMIFTVT